MPDPTLESLLADRAPPSAFRQLTKDRREAARLYGEAHARMNPIPTADAHCTFCNGLNASMVTSYRWAARYTDGVRFGWIEELLLLAGRIGVRVRYTIVSFDTHHATCEHCGKSLRVARRIANVLNFFGLFLTIVAGFCLALDVSGVFYFDRVEDRRFFWQLTAGSTALTLVGIVCLWFMRRLRVPEPLRYLARSPFRFGSAKLTRHDPTQR